MSTTETQIGVNTNLQKQDLSNLDISNLTPLSPEVISRQATINIGTIGHVAHGKSTVVKAISGVQTVRFKNELERNITIKLERISEQRIAAILKCPKLRKEYEAKESARVQRLYEERQQISLRSYSVDTDCSSSSRTVATRYKSKIWTLKLERGPSISPSSGYESLNDNISNYSGEFKQSLSSINRLDKIVRNLQKQPQQIEEKKIGSEMPILLPTAKTFKRSKTYDSDTNTDTPNRKRPKVANHEYVVDYIHSLESLNGCPVFFVKWLNYSDEDNTWESLSNLIECAQLEAFIEDRYAFYELPIATITTEIEEEIKRDGLVYDVTKLNVRQLDAYESLVFKTDLVLLAQFRNSRSRSKREPETIRKRILDALLLKPFYYQRKQQLISLRNFEERMNRVESLAPISVENFVDLEVPDTEFEYIKENFMGSNVKMDAQDPPIGCKCEEQCVPSGKCCARLSDGLFAYDKSGRLRIRSGEAIYECNSKCSCQLNCLNRVIQRGRQNALCLFKTPSGCGWGVRTERSMRKGEYVCEYVGEIITTDEANERGKQYDAIGRTYLFDLDYNATAESVYTIDAANYGNISHFINHSCDPNLAVFPFWIESCAVNMPRLAFFTLRPIKAGEELNFDYIRTDLGVDDYENLSEAEKVTCRCGATNCRKVLF